MFDTYLTILILVGTNVVVNGGKCVPPSGKAFRWQKCQNFNAPIRIETTSLDATQNGKPVEQNGGLDLHKPLTLTFGLKNTYKNEIPDHKFDFILYKYSDDDGPCKWSKVDFDGATDGPTDACKIIKNNCKYKGKPNKVVVNYDFQQMLGEFGASVDDFMSSGDYYAFDVTELDGTTKLGCIRIEARIK